MNGLSALTEGARETSADARSGEADARSGEMVSRGLTYAGEMERGLLCSQLHQAMNRRVDPVA